MKKAVLWALCILVCYCMGCGKTPENVIVREKGNKSIQKYESGEASEKSLADQLGVPAHYRNRAVYEDGRLVIDTDADVFVPDVKTVHTYEAAAKEETQKLVDDVTEVFFPGAKHYRNDSGYNYTKEYYQEKLTELKKFRAQGDLDPYGYGKDENGAYRFNMDMQISIYEENLKEAPEKSELTEVKPKLPSEKNEEGSFLCNTVTEHGNYDYSISYVPSFMAGIDFQINKVRDDFFAYWDEGEYLMDVEYLIDPTDPSTRKKKWKEEELLKMIPISFEEAKETAEEKADKLGMDLALYGWDYKICYRGENAILTENNVVDGGYVFYFTRLVDDIPITHTSTVGGEIEDEDMEAATTIPWKYELCNITVGGDGSVCEAEISNPYEIKGVHTENVKLMDFESIINIYEQMMEISWADLAEFEKLRTWHITKITFGYTRIYSPQSDNRAGILVPVWDFFGEFDSQVVDQEAEYNSGEHSTRSVMTINAIDGTLIDRGLGY